MTPEEKVEAVKKVDAANDAILAIITQLQKDMTVDVRGVDLLASRHIDESVPNKVTAVMLKVNILSES